MAIRERKNKEGKVIAWEVFYNHPITKKRVTQRFKSERKAEEENSKILHRLKFERDSFSVEEESPEARMVYLQDLIAKYLADRPMSKANKGDTLSHLEAFYDICGNPRIEDIDKKLMIKFERGCRKIKKRNGEVGLAQRTIHRKVSIIKSALNWAVEQEEIDGHNLQNYKCEKGQNKQFIPPTPKELQAILEHSPPHLKRVIRISFAFGLRVGESELFKLQWSHIDLDSNIAHIPAANKNKNVQWRDVHIPPDFAAVLAEWKAEDEEKGTPWVINYTKKGKPVTTIKRAWKSALQKADIGRHIRPYDIRHSFATQTLAAGADVKAVAEAMGHADTSMIHKHYQHVLDKQKKAVTENIPSLG